MKNMNKFIETKDLKTKQLLEQQGFIFLYENNGFWVFLNQFEDSLKKELVSNLFEQNKCYFSNTLSFIK